MLLVGRGLLARASELVALTVTDLTVDTDGALAWMRRRKTSTKTAR